MVAGEGWHFGAIDKLCRSRKAMELVGGWSGGGGELGGDYVPSTEGILFQER